MVGRPDRIVIDPGLLYLTWCQKPGYDYKKLEAKLPGAVTKYMGPQILQGMGMTLTQFRQKGNDVGLYLQPLTDIHLHSDCTQRSGARRRYPLRLYFGGHRPVHAPDRLHYHFGEPSSTAGALRRAREVGHPQSAGVIERGSWCVSSCLNPSSCGGDLPGVSYRAPLSGIAGF